MCFRVQVRSQRLYERGQFLGFEVTIDTFWVGRLLEDAYRSRPVWKVEWFEIEARSDAFVLTPSIRQTAPFLDDQFSQASMRMVEQPVMGNDGVYTISKDVYEDLVAKCERPGPSGTTSHTHGIPSQPNVVLTNMEALNNATAALVMSENARSRVSNIKSPIQRAGKLTNVSRRFVTGGPY